MISDLLFNSVLGSALAISSFNLGTSKTRYNNHTISFRNKCYKKETKLSKYVSKLKDKGEDFTIKWSVAYPYIYGIIYGHAACFRCFLENQLLLQQVLDCVLDNCIS